MNKTQLDGNRFRAKIKKDKKEIKIKTEKHKKQNRTFEKNKEDYKSIITKYKKQKRQQKYKKQQVELNKTRALRFNLKTKLIK